MRSSALGLCIALLAAVLIVPVHAAKPSTAVYVTTQPPAGTSDDDAKGLADAARELGDAVARRKHLRVVDDPASADVSVVVTNREQRDAGDGGFGGIKLTPLGEMIIRFHAKLTPRQHGAPDTDEVDLKGIGPGYWSRAAKDGAERLDKWISNHAAARRDSKPSAVGGQLSAVKRTITPPP